VPKSTKNQAALIEKRVFGIAVAVVVVV